jgi:transposase
MGQAVVKFGIGAPIENEVEVERQMSLARDYYNVCVDYLRAKRRTIREVQRAIGAAPVLLDQLDDAKEVRADVESRCNQWKIRNRTTTLSRELAEELKAAKKACKEASERASESARIRREMSPDYKERIAEAEALCKERQVLARRMLVEEFGMYWANYLVDDQSVEQAAKTKLYRNGKESEPRMRRKDGSGFVADQVQAGMPYEEVFRDTNRHVRIELPAESPDGRPRSKTSTMWHVLALRIGTDAKRAPVWARFPMVVHRDFPMGSRIKWVIVRRKRVGIRYRWQVEFSVDTPVGATKGPHGSGAVAIDIGWRKLRDGSVRVAYWQDDAGRSGEVTVSQKDMSSIERKDGLLAVRDKLFNEMRDSLLPMLRRDEQPSTDDFVRRTRNIGRWKAKKKYRSLAFWWRKNRFSGDEEAYSLLESWRYRDDHLHDWQAFQTRGSIGRRNDFFRRVAKSFAMQYESVTLEKFNISEVATRKRKSKASKQQADQASANRQAVGVHVLREYIIQAFLSRDGRVVEVPCKDTTRTCFDCGLIDSFDAASYLDRNPPCPGCGAVWDQDHNAAKNLLSAYLLWSSGRAESTTVKVTPDPSAAQKQRESRWSRRKRIKSEGQAATV